MMNPNEKVKLMFDYLQGPIWTSDVETGEPLTGIDIIDDDKILPELNLRCSELYSECYEFDIDNQPCTFSTDKKLHKLLTITISERFCRGVPKIVGKYGKEAIQIEKNRIIVTILFEKLGVNEFKVSNKVSNKVSKKLNKTQQNIISTMRDNPNITVNQLMIITGLSEPSVKKNLKQLKESGFISGIGANKNGY